MNNERFTQLFEKITEECKDVMIVKGSEYAGTGDRLANFKRNAVRGRTPIDVLDIYMAKHIDSVHTFMGKANNILRYTDISPEQKREDMLALFKQQSEPIEGRIVDLINYLLLFNAMCDELQHAEPAPYDMYEMSCRK